MKTLNDNRVVFLDWLRMISIFMVILVHCIEPFYYGGPEGTYIASRSDAIWVTLINSALRPCVPLFVLASSFLLFPVTSETSTFLKKRGVRVVIPFLIWSIIYAVVPPFGSGGQVDVLADLKYSIFNFSLSRNAHFWFVYMIIGLYLLMPMLSPWIRTLTARGERAFLYLWAFTTLIPFIRIVAEDVTGSTLIWGECFWNPFGAFYYVSGYVGYLVLGHYFRTHVGEISWKKTLSLAVPFWVAGYAITAGMYWYLIPHELGYPLSAPLSAVMAMEIPWCFCTPGVMLQTVAYFLVIRKFTSSGWFYDHVVLPISKMSYGMYLLHMLVLIPVVAWVRTWDVPTPLTMLISAVITYFGCIIATKLLSLLPKSKYIVG